MLFNFGRHQMKNIIINVSPRDFVTWGTHGASWNTEYEASWNTGFNLPEPIFFIKFGIQHVYIYLSITRKKKSFSRSTVWLVCWRKWILIDFVFIDTFFSFIHTLMDITHFAAAETVYFSKIKWKLFELYEAIVIGDVSLGEFCVDTYFRIS